MRPVGTTVLVSGASAALVAAAVASGALWLYHRHVVRPALLPRFGVVDVAEVYRRKEAEFTLLLTRASSDAEREGAMRMAKVFAQRLPTALDELARDCACPVLVSTALAAPAVNTIDMTLQLRRKVDGP